MLVLLLHVYMHELIRSWTWVFLFQRDMLPRSTNYNSRIPNTPLIPNLFFLNFTSIVYLSSFFWTARNSLVWESVVDLSWLLERAITQPGAGEGEKIMAAMCGLATYVLSSSVRWCRYNGGNSMMTSSTDCHYDHSVVAWGHCCSAIMWLPWLSHNVVSLALIWSPLIDLTSLTIVVCQTWFIINTLYAPT